MRDDGRQKNQDVAARRLPRQRGAGVEPARGGGAAPGISAGALLGALSRGLAVQRQRGSLRLLWLRQGPGRTVGAACAGGRPARPVRRRRQPRRLRWHAAVPPQDDQGEFSYLLLV